MRVLDLLAGLIDGLVDYLDLRVWSSDGARFVLVSRGDYLPDQAMRALLAQMLISGPPASIDRAREERILSSKIGEA